MQNEEPNESQPGGSNRRWAQFRFSVIGSLLAAPPQKGQLQESIKELVAEMKANDKYGPLFRSEQRTGGGKSPVQARPGQQQADLSPTGKIAAGLGKGQASRTR